MSHTHKVWALKHFFLKLIFNNIRTTSFGFFPQVPTDTHGTTNRIPRVTLHSLRSSMCKSSACARARVCVSGVCMRCPGWPAAQWRDRACVLWEPVSAVTLVDSEWLRRFNDENQGMWRQVPNRSCFTQDFWLLWFSSASLLRTVRSGRWCWGHSSADGRLHCGGCVST